MVLLCHSALADYEAGMEAYRKALGAYSTGDLTESRRWIQQALRTDPENPSIHTLAGDLDYLAHQLESAADHWRQALALEPRLRPLKERLMQLEQEEALEKEQVRGSAGLYLVRLPADSPIELDEIFSELKQAQIFLEEALQVRLEGPIPVLGYSPDVFHGDLHLPTVVAGLYDGKIRLAIGQDGQEPSFRAVLWHELTHAAVHQISKGKAPRWLHEGVAQKIQSRIEPVSANDLRIVAQQQDAPLLKDLGRRSGMIQIDQTPPLHTQLFYQAAWAYVEYVVEHHGWAGVKSLLSGASQADSPSVLLSALAKMREPEWERHWRRWLNQRLRLPS